MLSGHIPQLRRGLFVRQAFTPGDRAMARCTSPPLTRSWRGRRPGLGRTEARPRPSAAASWPRSPCGCRSCRLSAARSRRQEAPARFRRLPPRVRSDRHATPSALPRNPLRARAMARRASPTQTRSRRRQVPTVSTSNRDRRPRLSAASPALRSIARCAASPLPDRVVDFAL